VLHYGKLAFIYHKIPEWDPQPPASRKNDTPGDAPGIVGADSVNRLDEWDGSPLPVRCSLSTAVVTLVPGDNCPAEAKTSRIGEPHSYVSGFKGLKKIGYQDSCRLECGIKPTKQITDEKGKPKMVKAPDVEIPRRSRSSSSNGKRPRCE
jgi:hypothetical protein